MYLHYSCKGVTIPASATHVQQLTNHSSDCSGPSKHKEEERKAALQGGIVFQG